MAFDFDKYIRKLDIFDGFKIKSKKRKGFVDWFASKEGGLFGIGADDRFFRVFNKKPTDNELKDFIKAGDKFIQEYGAQEILLIAPDVDNFAFKKLMERLGSRTLFNLAKAKKTQAKAEKEAKPKKEPKAQKVEKKVETQKQTKKLPQNDRKIFKRVCRIAKDFEVMRLMKVKEANLEEAFYSVLKYHPQLKKEKIVFEKRKSTGRFDIYFPERKIAIELKLIKRSKDLFNLAGQILQYEDDFNFLCAFIVMLKTIPSYEVKDAIKKMERANGEIKIIKK